MIAMTGVRTAALEKIFEISISIAVTFN